MSASDVLIRNPGVLEQYDSLSNSLFASLYICRHIAIISNEIEIKKKLMFVYLFVFFVFLSIKFLINRDRNISACFRKLFL
jgi:hypothetical protein